MTVLLLWGEHRWAEGAFTGDCLRVYATACGKGPLQVTEEDVCRRDDG